MPVKSETMLALSLSTLPPIDERSLERVNTDALDWDFVLKKARDWEIEGPVLTNLLALFSDRIPERVRLQAETALKGLRMYTLSRTLVALNVADACEQAGVPLILLKGPAVGILGYGSPLLRQFGDLDFLVAPADLSAAKNALERSGYRPDYRADEEAQLIREQTPLNFTNGSVSIELHYSLFSPKWRCDFDVESVFRESRIVSCLDRTIRVLSAEHLFVYLCAHGVRHVWSSPRWICDIAQLASRYDSGSATKVAAFAERTNTRRILAVGLRLARDVIGPSSDTFSPRQSGEDRDTSGLIGIVQRNLGLTQAGAAHVDFLASRHPAFYWIRSRERTRDQIGCFLLFLFSRTPGDVSPGIKGILMRPIRLVRGALSH